MLLSRKKNIKWGWGRSLTTQQASCVGHPTNFNYFIFKVINVENPKFQRCNVANDTQASIASSVEQAPEFSKVSALSANYNCNMLCVFVQDEWVHLWLLNILNTVYRSERKALGVHDNSDAIKKVQLWEELWNMPRAPRFLFWKKLRELCRWGPWKARAAWATSVRTGSLAIRWLLDS